MFRIALCDDNQAFLDFEEGLIEQHLTENSISFQCDGYLSGSELLARNEDICKYDLFILDYDMDGLTGFETASKIYEKYPSAKIAFATNYYNFTREGYKYNAVRYLVKQEESFYDELIECVNYVMKTEPKKSLLIETRNGLVETAVEDILYVASNKHYIEYVLSDGRTLSRRCSLDEAQTELPEYFVRVHQSYSVNLKYSMQLRRSEIYIRGREKTIPVARNRFDEVNRKFYLLKGDFS